MEPFLVNQTRWSDLIKQLSVAKGLDHVQVLADLVGAIVLENDRPEHKYLAGERLGWGQNLTAAIAAVTSFVGLRNPLASGTLVIVEHFHGIAGGATSSYQRIYYGLVRGATLTAVATEQPRDTRLQPTGVFGTAAPGIAAQVVSGRSDTITVTPFVVGELIFTGNTAVATAAVQPVEIPVVLAPGDTLLMWPSDAIGGNTTNLAIQGSFFWRERTQEPTET